MLQSLAAWPPLVVYLLIALSCVVENFFPPAPSDVFVLLAAFLSHQGAYQPTTIFLTAWLSGIAGSIAVYAVARRYADRFAGSKLGQALLPADAARFLLKEYGRYGWLGMLLTRILPGFRSVVAPFAGLSGLSLRQLLIPVVVATALWYGMLTWVGARLGDEWDRVLGLFNRINSTLGVVAVVVAVILVALVVRWRRKRRAE